MDSKTKIMVFRMRELIYTGILIVLGIALIVLLLIMFRPSKKASAPNPSTEQTEDLSSPSAQYVPGVYTTSILLGEHTIDVAVTVDEHKINSVRFVNLSESVSVMYPLMESVMDDLSAQICQTQSVSEVTYSSENQYTSEMLLDAVKAALETAKKAGDAN